MRKIFSLIVILCTISALAHEHIHAIAADNAAQNASPLSGGIAQQVILAAADEPDSLDAKKNKIVEELKAKKDSTQKDVVKSYIDKSIEDVNAADAAKLDSIMPMIQAKVDGCLEVENKEKTTADLKDIDHQLVSPYYTDITNAETVERAKTLVSEAVGIIGLRPNKDGCIRDINGRFNQVPVTSKNFTDEDAINKYVDDINKATTQAAVDGVHRGALDRIKLMTARGLRILHVTTEAAKANLSLEEMAIIGEVTTKMLNCNTDMSLKQEHAKAMILLGDKNKRDVLVEVRRAFPLGMGEAGENHFYNLAMQGGDGAANRAKIAIAAYKAGQGGNPVGTLGNKQKGPVLELTDQNDKVIRLYNPKRTEIKK